MRGAIAARLAGLAVGARRCVATDRATPCRAAFGAPSAHIERVGVGLVDPPPHPRRLEVRSQPNCVQSRLDRILQSGVSSAARTRRRHDRYRYPQRKRDQQVRCRRGARHQSPWRGRPHTTRAQISRREPPRRVAFPRPDRGSDHRDDSHTMLATCLQRHADPVGQGGAVGQRRPSGIAANPVG